MKPVYKDLGRCSRREMLQLEELCSKLKHSFLPVYQVFSGYFVCYTRPMFTYPVGDVRSRIRRILRDMTVGIGVAVLVSGCFSDQSGVGSERALVSDPALDSAPVVVFDGETRFYRFTSEPGHTPPSPEPKAQAGLEYRNILYASYASHTVVKMEVQATDQNTVLLGDLLEPYSLDENVDAVFVVAESGMGRAFTSIPFSSVKEPRTAASLEINVVPDHILEMDIIPDRLIRKVDLTAKPILKFPMEYRSRKIRIPGKVRLDFGIARDPVNAYDPASPIRFSVLAQGSETTETLYSHVIEPHFLTDPDPGWLDVSLDLGGLEGREVQFVFLLESSNTEKRDEFNTIYPVVGNPVLYQSEFPRVKETPNIILISLDTLRADHLGCYGYDKETSPNIDRFAKESVLFERCIAPSSWTTPSHASLFTGLQLSQHEAGGLKGWRLGDRFTTMAELAQDNGYLTAAFTEGLAVGGGFGFHQGFDRYSDGTLRHPLPPGTAEIIFGDAQKWLTEYRRFPFFLFVHTYELHAPYQPPPPFLERFIMGTETSIVPSLETLSDEKRREAVALYDGEIAYTDHVFGQFIEELRSSGILEQSVVILFSDHGEEFWEHDNITHGFTLYDEMLHVPLLIRLPGGEQPTGRIQRPVSLTDLFDTVLELLQLDPRNTEDSYSLIPLLEEGDSTSGYGRSVVFGELLQKKNEYLLLSAENESFKYISRTDFRLPESPVYELIKDENVPPPAVMEQGLLQYLDGDAVSSSDDITVKAATSEALFDLTKDPGEMKNVASEKESEMGALRSSLLLLLNKFVEVGDASEFIAPLTEDEREGLETLGYL